MKTYQLLTIILKILKTVEESKTLNPWQSTLEVCGREKMWNASRFCVSSLRRGHANLLCIVPILVYVLPKQVHRGRQILICYINVLSLWWAFSFVVVCIYLFRQLQTTIPKRNDMEYEKRHQSDFVGRADYNRPLTGAVPLLIDTEALGCWVTPLARCASP